MGLAVAWAWAAGWVTLGAMFGSAGLSGARAVVGAIMQAILPGLIFVLIAAVATRRPRLGAMLLLLTGATIAGGYPFIAPGGSLSAILFIEGAMALPPLVAGALLLAARRRPGATD